MFVLPGCQSSNNPWSPDRSQASAAAVYATSSEGEGEVSSKRQHTCCSNWRNLLLHSRKPIQSQKVDRVVASCRWDPTRIADPQRPRHSIQAAAAVFHLGKQLQDCQWTLALASLRNLGNHPGLAANPTIHLPPWPPRFGFSCQQVTQHLGQCSGMLQYDIYNIYSMIHYNRKLVHGQPPMLRCRSQC